MSDRNERRRAYYAANQEKIAEQRRAYREANKEQYYTKRREYRQRTKDQQAEYRKKYYQNNRESALLRRRRREAAKYGLTIEQYNLLIAEAHGNCNLCGTTEPGGPHNKFNVDHSHTTGTIRGVLCQACNTGIGKLGDTYESLVRAAEYLRNPPMAEIISRIFDDGLLV